MAARRQHTASHISRVEVVWKGVHTTSTRVWAGAGPREMAAHLICCCAFSFSSFSSLAAAVSCLREHTARCLAECTGVIPDIFDFTAEAAHFATLVRALCGRPETSCRPGHTVEMEREHPVDSRSAETALVLRERRRKNHYTESFKLWPLLYATMYSGYNCSP